MNRIPEARWLLFDVEADGLKATKIWCLSYEDYKGTKGTVYDYEDVRDLLRNPDYDVLVGHNIIRWDIPTLERILRIEIKKTLIDTLPIAWYLEPERGSHGLESYGESYEIHKPKISDWENGTIDEYRIRCETDREINLRLFRDQLRHLQEIYDDPKTLWSFLRYLSHKMYQARLAEESGWLLDEEYCREAIKELEAERTEKLNALTERMPRVPIVETHNAPKRQYKANGELSVLGRRWQEELATRGLPEDYDGTLESITGTDDPNPRSVVQLKAWLYDLGWIPQTIKVQRNKKTGEIKEIPQVSKEKQKGGGVCDSIKLLYDKEPALENLDGFYILSHRISILNGYLRDVDPDGLLHACIQGLTNTLRFKHAEIVNLPKPDARYGLPVRHALMARSGHEHCGADMASLEDRLKQHFIFPHDPDYVAELNKSDYDPHLDLALTAGAVTKEEVDAYKQDRYTRKATRSTYKNGNYACQYGAGIPRLQITCGCDYETAERIHTAYWKRNWAIKAVAKEQIVKTVRGMMWLYNPISGFWYSLRSKKDIFSTLVQGSAAYCFDVWVRYVLKGREQLTAQFHDEIVLEVLKGYRDEIVSFLEQTIKDTNEELGLNRELGIGIQFGSRYSEIH